MADEKRVPRVGVACLALRAGRVLLVLRHGAHGAGTWAPPGGHLDFGESPAECAARETREETGIGVSNLEFVGLTSDLFPEVDRHYVTIWMRGDAEEREATIRAPRELADLGWFAPDDLPAPLFLSFENLLAGRGLPPAPPNLPFHSCQSSVLR